MFLFWNSPFLFAGLDSLYKMLLSSVKEMGLEVKSIACAPSNRAGFTGMGLGEEQGMQQKRGEGIRVCSG